MTPSLSCPLYPKCELVCIFYLHLFPQPLVITSFTISYTIYIHFYLTFFFLRQFQELQVDVIIINSILYFSQAPLVERVSHIRRECGCVDLIKVQTNKPKL